ncbi:hypothetical protein INT43_002388 [Umbelopsis isabellina]|uniref:Uncharacterized protein n=1 Tax=Mortierella isabellina TaxID=91625 RepID=A0A8H7Q5J3_MORIS|nr:hypothetical protein INT43_002388 [Umbelopsis isabellina]
MSSTAARNEIQSLYRSYLRLISEWPVDRVRPNRDMKKVLTARVQEMFRQTDNAQVDIQEARRQLDALERLLSNEFKEKYPLSDKIVSPASNPNYYSRLVASLEAQKSNKNGGPFARFFGSTLE